MPKLILKMKAEVIDEFNMKSTQTSCTIGSDKFNNIVIHDKLVSMTHASIERRVNGYYLRDLNSAFGTFLNGQKIDDIAPLKNGDVIEIGNHAIVFDHNLEEIAWTPPEQREANYFSNTGGGKSPENRVESANWRTPGDVAEEESLTTGAREIDWAPYYLLAIYGPYKGKRFQLRYGETKIGRDENLNDIILQNNPRGEIDQSISRRHAMVYFQNNSFFVRDKRSKTRTHVNQMVVPVDEDVEIFPEDEIEIVSDQQSTIFRFVPEGQFDFSPPKKAGVWWVRYQAHFKRGAAALAMIIGGFLATTGFLERAMLLQKPQPFTVELSQWVTDESGSLPSENGDAPASIQPAVIADYNRDGFVDIITTNITSKPFLIDGKSRLPKWIIDTAPADPLSPFISADVNQDDIADLLYISSDGRVTAIDGLFGAEIWISPFSNAQLIGPPTVDDFDGDGLNDVAIANSDGVVHVGYNRIVDMEWFQIATELPIKCPLTSADMNRDGLPELLCGTERGLVLVINSRERTIDSAIDINEELNRARGVFFEDNQIRHPVGAADLNGDQQIDVIVTTLQGRIIAINGATKSRLWYDVFTDELTISEGSLLPFALGHFDDDELEDVAAFTNLGEIRAYRGKGEDQGARILWQVAAEENTTSSRALVVTDVNKDGMTDVAFVEGSGELKILDGRSGQNLLSSAPTLPHGVSIPLVADLSKDGFLDVLAVDREGKIYQFQSNSRIPKAMVLWGQRYGRCNNAMAQSSQLPPPLKADISMALGLLMFVGAGAAAFITQRKRRRTHDR